MSEKTIRNIRGEAEHASDQQRTPTAKTVPAETSDLPEHDLGGALRDSDRGVANEDSERGDSKSWPGRWSRASLREFLRPWTLVGFGPEQLESCIDRGVIKVPADLFALAKDRTILESTLDISKISAFAIGAEIADSQKAPLSKIIRCFLGDNGTDALVSALIKRYKSYGDFWHGIHAAINLDNPEHVEFMSLPGMTLEIMKRLWTFETTLSGDIHDFVCRVEII